MHILVVEDHQEMLALLVQCLQRDGHRVEAAGTVQEARRAWDAQFFDVILLDLGLPDGSGLDLCRQARAQGVTTPILMLTAHAAVRTRVEGLDAGADDFLAKPFAVAELRARIRALGRRRDFPTGLLWRRGNIVLDFPKRRAVRDGQEVPLTSREWGILEVLASARGHIVPRGRILEEVWGGGETSAGASLEVLVGRIRKKLGEDVVRTARGEGYGIAE